MPTISKGDKVLVTGANGYVAMWLIRLLLERGYKVRGTVRTPDKGEYIENYLATLGLAVGFEYVVAKDLTAAGAFDDAVKGVDAIAHTASYVHDVDDSVRKQVQDFYGPAIQGTVGILDSVLRNAPRQIKRILVTSSAAALVTLSQLSRTYNETHWNEEAPKQVEETGSDTPPMVIYRASKTLAEKSAWKWINDHREEVSCDISTIIPPYIFGPPLQQAQTPSNLNASLGFWYDAVMTSTPKPKQRYSESACWVDVRDLALSHVLALEKPEAGGERLIISSGLWRWQDWVDIAGTLQPEIFPDRKLLKGYPEITQENPPYRYDLDTTKGQRILGIMYRNKEETTRDIMEDFAKRGW